MLRLVAPGDDAGAGVETGAAEGELDEPPQDGSAAVSSRARHRLGGIANDIVDGRDTEGTEGVRS
jgi:hypothetical protein